MFAEGSRNEQEICAVGDRGKVECFVPESNVVIGTRIPRDVKTEHVPVDEHILKAGFHHGATYFQHRAFADAIRGGAPPAVGVPRRPAGGGRGPGRRDLRTGETARRALRAGGRLMRWLLRALGIAAVLALAGAGWVAWRLQDRPDLSRYARYEMSAAPPATRRPRVSVTFLGIATLLISDGETHLMTDGWFTRVGLGDLLLQRAVSPDTDAIARGLQRAGVTRLAAVMPVHSHYDHAQDAPEVARRTGALLLGSESTAWIGRGAGMREQQIRVVEPGVPTHFGKFTVTHILSKHVPLPGNAQ